MNFSIKASLCLLLVALIFWSCGSSQSPYPSDERFIEKFKQNKDLFMELLADPENKNLFNILGIERLQICSSVRYQV
jgi:hypothetical protein